MRQKVGTTSASCISLVTTADRSRVAVDEPWIGTHRDRTQAYSDIWSLAKAQPNTIATTPLKEPVEELEVPAVYDTGFSWEDGIGIQSGWGGRRR